MAKLSAQVAADLDRTQRWMLRQMNMLADELMLTDRQARRLLVDGVPVASLKPPLDRVERWEERFAVALSAARMAGVAEAGAFVKARGDAFRVRKLAGDLAAGHPSQRAAAVGRAREMILEVELNNHRALRRTVARVLEGDVTLAEATRQLRRAGGAQLDVRSAEAVERYRQTQEKLLRKRHPDARERWLRGRVNGATERYAQQKRQQSALRIVRTESMRAYNEGVDDMWWDMVQSGELSRDAEKEWRTVEPCKVCKRFEGRRVPVGSWFGNVSGPPLHPNCNCRIELV